MSAIPALRPQPEIEILRRPIPRHEPAVRPRIVATPKAKVNVAGIVVAKAVLFGATLALTLAANSLAGSVMIEKARTAGRTATIRSRSATMALQSLQVEMARLEDSQLLAGWATRHGFVASVQPVASSVSGDPREAEVH